MVLISVYDATLSGCHGNDDVGGTQAWLPSVTLQLSCLHFSIFPHFSPLSYIFSHPLLSFSLSLLFSLYLCLSLFPSLFLFFLSPLYLFPLHFSLPLSSLSLFSSVSPISLSPLFLRTFPPSLFYPSLARLLCFFEQPPYIFLSLFSLFLEYI